LISPGASAACAPTAISDAVRTAKIETRITGVLLRLVPLPLFENPEDAEEATEIPAPAVARSSTRGLILHKLIEELLTGELQGGVLEIERRSIALLGQLGIKPVDDPKTGIAPTEIAGTVVRTLNLPEIAPLHSRLGPEHSVFGHGTTAEGEVLVSGIADPKIQEQSGRCSF
jgi:hypothetical protein